MVIKVLFSIWEREHIELLLYSLMSQKVADKLNYTNKRALESNLVVSESPRKWIK